MVMAPLGSTAWSSRAWFASSCLLYRSLATTEHGVRLSTHKRQSSATPPQRNSHQAFATTKWSKPWEVTASWCKGRKIFARPLRELSHPGCQHVSMCSSTPTSPIAGQPTWPCEKNLTNYPIPRLKAPGLSYGDERRVPLWGRGEGQHVRGFRVMCS